LTTGRDGEEFDLLEKTSKPKVALPAGTFFSCLASEIQKHSPFLTVLEKTGYKASGHSIWLVKAESDLEVEIVGPPTVNDQIKLAEKMLQYGAEYVIIDGSLDRKAISTSDKIDSIIVVGGAAFGDISAIKKEFSRFQFLSQILQLQDKKLLDELAKYDKLAIVYQEQGSTDTTLMSLPSNTLLGYEKELASHLKNWKDNITYIYIPTSLSEKSYLQIKAYFPELETTPLIIRHPFNLYLEESTVKLLHERGKLFAINELSLSGFVVNSYDPKGSHLVSDDLRSDIRGAFKLPVIDVYEVQSIN
jgi:hypothetical protein